MSGRALTADPAVRHGTEGKRLGAQARTILAMLQVGPVSNDEMATVSLKYTSRISDLRRAGHRISIRERNHATGYTLYAYDGFQAPDDAIPNTPEESLRRLKAGIRAYVAERRFARRDIVYPAGSGFSHDYWIGRDLARELTSVHYLSPSMLAGIESILSIFAARNP